MYSSVYGMYFANKMHYSFTFLLCVFTITSCSVARTKKVIYDLENAEELFKDFIRDYDKSYDDAEYKMRFAIFTESLKRYNKRNAGDSLAEFGITKFADYTEQELSQVFGCVNIVDDDMDKCTYKNYTPSGTPPPSLDYRDKHLVTDVKDQGQCGSCYAFAAVGALEGQYANKTETLISFSSQQIVDCDKNDEGCDGGNPPYTLTYLMDGIVKEEDYPYAGVVQSCSFDKSKVITRVTKCTFLSITNEEDMKSALAEFGPLYLAVNGNPFQDYQSGIMDSCEEGRMNHAVLLVGYGNHGDVPYWIIKNSWGVKWGIDGYIHVKMGHKLCHVSEYIFAIFI